MEIDITPENGDPVAFRQSQFVQTYDSAKAHKEKLSGQKGRRLFFAVILKGIAVFGGLAITYGLPDPWPKIIGFAISACVAIDIWLSNHKRLMGITEAIHAYERILFDARNKQTLELGPILDLKEKGDSAAREKLTILYQSLIEELQKEVKLIKSALAKLDIEALRSLKPEQPEESR